MPDTNAPTLAEQALSRLRKLAEGNGVDPQKIEITGSDEKIFELEGTLTLTPKCDAQVARYPGMPRGAGKIGFRSFGELHEEVKKRQDEFTQGRDWVDGAVKELKDAPGEGWGLQGAQVTLPNSKPIVLAATQTCPTCQGRKLLTCQQCGGQGYVICPHCQGRKQEPCLNCGGTGNNPAQPGTPCPICNGNRFTSCRFCRATGQLTCPTCHGRRGTTCPGCNGTGQITEEITLTLSIDTQFKLKSAELPSGLRRGLDRLGISNLGKGHADIRIVQAKAKTHEEDLKRIREEEKNSKSASHTVTYEAHLPYADLRMNFNGKKALVSSFGKKAALLGVPLFLDAALEPTREVLRNAARGNATLNAALDTRITKEALALSLAGQGSVAELRRTYSVGLSSDAAKEILRNLRLALNRHTLKIRRITAGAAVALSTLCFGLIFQTSLHTEWTAGWSVKSVLVLDILLPLIPMALAYAALSMSVYMALQRRFIAMKISLHQKGGKTGYGMLAAIFVLYWLMLLTAPEKPLWLLQLFI